MCWPCAITRATLWQSPTSTINYSPMLTQAYKQLTKYGMAGLSVLVETFYNSHVIKTLCIFIVSLMNFQSKLEKLIEEYLNESDKTSIQQISIDIPGYNGQFFITDAAIIDIEKSSNNFLLAIHFSFNGASKQGQKLKEKIANHPVLAEFQITQESKNTIGYTLKTNNDKFAVAKMVELIIQTLSPGIELAIVGAELKKVKWHILKD
jgi:hypothetical protein